MGAADRRALLEEEVAALTACIREHGVMIVGSRGQPVLNPAVTARHGALAELRRLDNATPPEPPPHPMDALLATEPRYTTTAVR